MRLIAKCGETLCNIKVDAIERQDNVIYAYLQNSTLTATSFCGMFSLDSMDFLYITNERET